MRMKIAAFIVALITFLTIVPVWAHFSLISAQATGRGSQNRLDLPPSADNSPVISLGSAVDGASGKVVDGLAIIHYKKNEARSTNNARAPKNQCYSFLATGAKWKTIENWTVNTTNNQNLDSSFIFSNISADISKWEDAADGKIGTGPGANILGDGVIAGEELVADLVSPDNKNEVYFADVSESGVIAVTIVWGIFSGPTFQRQLVEWDMVIDEVDFNWSATGEAGKMDVENIITHELGHSVGMADLYNTCTGETMYGWADFGETKKRSLNSGDISGVNSLY